MKGWNKMIFYNIEDFGAIADGKTLATDAINKAKLITKVEELLLFQVVHSTPDPSYLNPM